MSKMYKRTVLFSLIVFAMILSIVAPNSIEAKSMKTKAESAIIVDVETGKILYAKNENEALPPASMTKMMTEYIVLDKINSGDLKWDDKTQISDYAYEISANNNFSGVGLTQDKDYTVKELYEAMAIYSDNATSIALAELISGTEGKFVELMNETGEKLGLTDFKFVNSNGLDNKLLDGKHPEGTKADDTNLLSAKSAALLAYHLVSDYPEVLETTSVTNTTFDGLEITNYNWMLPHDSQNLKQFYYEGVDGLKTGHTDLAGYAFTSTAEKDGQRLITVVMRTKSVEERFKETARLLDFGFKEFGEVELFPAGHQLETEKTLDVSKGKADKVGIEIAEKISAPIQKGTEGEYNVSYEIDESLLNKDGQLEAPIKKGDKVGVAKLIYEGENDPGYITEDKTFTVDIVATEDVEKKNWFSLLMSGIGSFFASLFTKITDLF